MNSFRLVAGFERGLVFRASLLKETAKKVHDQLLGLEAGLTAKCLGQLQTLLLLALGLNKAKLIKNSIQTPMV